MKALEIWRTVRGGPKGRLGNVALGNQRSRVSLLSLFIAAIFLLIVCGLDITRSGLRDLSILFYASFSSSLSAGDSSPSSLLISGS